MPLTQNQSEAVTPAHSDAGPGRILSWEVTSFVFMALSSLPSSHAPPPPGTGTGHDSASSWSRSLACPRLHRPLGPGDLSLPARARWAGVGAAAAARFRLAAPHPAPSLHLLLPRPSIPSCLHLFHCLSSKHSLSSRHTGCCGSSRFSAELRSSPLTPASGPPRSR